MSGLDALETPTFSQPFASRSRAVFTLPYKPVGQEAKDEESFELYDEAWGQCRAKIHSTLSTLHDESLDQIVQFVADSQDDSTALITALAARSSIRTGLIIGASPGSSSFLYSALCRQLTDISEETTCLVSRFASRDCSNIKSAMRSLISGFLGSNPVDVEEEDENEEGPNVTAGKSSSLAPEDFQNLVAWYNHHYKRNGVKSNRPTLVVLIEDLEAMDARVLSQIISILSHYVDVLPLALLIGVATSSSALFNAIPRPIANLLHATTFFVEPGVGAFTALIRGLFIDWLPPLALGPKVYQYLWKVFEDSHHSIEATVSAIQYIYIHHFTSKSYSLATLSLDGQLIDQPDHLVTAIKKLPSLIQFLEAESINENPSENFIAALQSNDTETFFGVVEECRRVRAQWQISLQNGFEMLLLIQQSWERIMPMEKLLLMHSEGNLALYSNELCNMILKSNSTKLVAFLTAAANRFETGDEENPSSQQIDFETLRSILARPRAADRINLINDNVNGSNFIHGGNLTQDDRDFSQIVRKISGSLREDLRNAFEPSTGILLHELWFAHDIYPLRRFHPSILPTYHNALIKEPTGDEIETDVAVAYRLYRDTGKTINLGDWWMAFDGSARDEPKVIIEEDEEAEDIEMNGNSGNSKKGKGKQNNKRQRAESVEEDDDEEDDDEEEDEEDGPLRRKQARFLRAIGDLAYVGFLQPTTRKVEHVFKSVF